MDNKNNTTEMYEISETKRILDYWTPERIANANPIQPPNISKKNLMNQKNISNTEPNTIIPPSTFNNLLISDGEPYEVNAGEAPYESGGKIFFTVGEGDKAQDKYGSAQFVGHCQMVLTAAHCVRDNETGNYYNNLCFIKGFKLAEDKTVEGKKFVIEQAMTTDKYVGKFDIAYDYAFCRTKDSSPTWFGLQTGIPHEKLHAIGYPSNFGEGKVMQGVDGTKSTINNGVVRMKNNPMRHGNSGGAWIANLCKDGCQGSSQNLVVGLNSAHDDETAELGPFFAPRGSHENIFDLFYTMLHIANNPRCE
ncbi:trypsin-like serine peptidase [Bacillus subtilis]|uniref:Serine protease n=1 Tax=Bacillus subtilis TaxID=1423 RepID=A0A1J0AKU3_BACIU|nr:trypsin-like peptidase domain-containing protein [Bacillus subtilis]APB62359.1 hypothetical protein pBS72_0900 [Bacillus subtilis]MEC3664983.1 trypsin-like peptidase domain-containing protein [Bacillus subtilis]